jgi:hypothetical protein
MGRKELYWTKLSLKEIGIWASEGILKSIAVNVADDWKDLAKLVQFRMFGESRILFGLPSQTLGEMLFQKYMEVVREAAMGPLALGEI